MLPEAALLSRDCGEREVFHTEMRRAKPEAIAARLKTGAEGEAEAEEETTEEADAGDRADLAAGPTE